MAASAAVPGQESLAFLQDANRPEYILRLSRVRAVYARADRREDATSLSWNDKPVICLTIYNYYKIKIILMSQQRGAAEASEQPHPDDIHRRCLCILHKRLSHFAMPSQIANISIG